MNIHNNFYIERTCTESTYSTDGNLEGYSDSKFLASFRMQDAYVLLGEPGAGKTKSFEHEAKQPDCIYVKARELIGFDVQKEWESKTLFIDGLDEVRIGSSNGLIPLDAIRNKLLQLNKPKFRLSCREADWLGASDRSDIEAITKSGRITVLHLEEFSEDDIKEFSAHENSSLEIPKFIDWCHKHTLMPMLGNPQILKLVIKTTSDKTWPDNKRDIYNISCKKMVRDSNIAHQQSKESKESKIYSEDQLIDSAGKLFAHQLISGNEGYSILQTEVSKYNPYYGSVFKNDIEAIRASLKTNLFKHGTSNETREPVHRSIAEYLAAKYLSELVENKGLPLRRLLSLITTADGGVASSLRGLFAWFLTLCPSQRSLLLNYDPLGIVLYGDVAAFSKEQKKDLFSHLYNEAEKHPGFRSENWISSPFGALATRDMEDVIRNYLETHLRDDTNQVLVDCVIDAVENGEIYTNFNATLLGIINDHTWWPKIRQKALRALLRIPSAGNEKLVLQILNDVNNKEIEDDDDQLLGTLLSNLYPLTISADNIFDYFHHPKDTHLIGSYSGFWSRTLLNKTSDENIPVLLDQFCRRNNFKEFLSDSYSLYQFIGELLIKGVTKHGDKISVKRLYNWLGAGLDKHEFSILRHVKSGNNQVSIQQWISDRPQLYKDLLVEGRSLCMNGVRTWKYFHNITARLYNAATPIDIGAWYLKQAETIGQDEIAEDYFCQAVLQIGLERTSKNFTLDTILTWVNKYPRYNSLLQQMLIVEGKEYDRILESAQRKLTRESGQIEKRSDYINHIVNHKKDIKNGSAPPAIFHDLAFAYYGHLMDVEGETAHERVSSLLNNSSELTTDALSGLKMTIFRKDLPTVEEIIKTSTIGKTYYIGHAVLAGLEDRSLSDNSDWEKITDSQYEKAIIFQLVEHTGDTPIWFKKLLGTRPDLISKVYVQYVTASARANKDHISSLYQLAYDEEWSYVAKKSIIKLLDKYPVRTKNSQAYNFEYMLKAGLRYANKPAFLKIIDKKLGYASMNIMQRSRWLAAGLILEPNKYEKRVMQFMDHSETRTRAIASFLSSKREEWQPNLSLPATMLEILIQKLGTHFKPYNFKGVSSVTPDMNAADMVSDFIRQLSTLDAPNVAEIFDKLILSQDIEEWHSSLKGARYEYIKRVRDASFIQPNIESVVKTLANMEPSNPADLMAITLDHLETLAIKIRRSNTNDYRQYWNTDKNDKPINPKVENACRDALLSDLKISLEKYNAHAEKEGHFVEDKRSDIKISYVGRNNFIVPVEIKRDYHIDVWKSLWSQLIEQYTQDPDSQGYGIYLVFWFGTGKTPPPPQGRKPETAEQMKALLLDMMSEDEKRLIGLCIIDCSVSDNLINRS